MNQATHVPDPQKLDEFQRTLLVSTFEPDQQKRTAAQYQLDEFQRTDFGAYVLELARVLHAAHADIKSRRAAGLTLKNLIESNSKQSRYDYAKRWLQVDQGIRQNVKQLVLATLESADNQRLHADIAQCIGYIGVTELAVSQWDDLVPRLLALCGSQSSKTCIIGAMQALSYLCDQLKQDDRDDCLQDGDTNKILSVIMQNVASGDMDIKLSAIKAFKYSMEFFEKNFQVDGERDYIVQAVGNLAHAGQGQSTDIRTVACECLCMFIEHYYPFMHAYIEHMFLVTSTILNEKDEECNLKIQAIEFWTTVCETEQSIASGNPKFFFDQLHPCESKNYAMEALQYNLIPSILALLPPEDEDVDDETMSLRNVSSMCLGYFANTTGNAIIPHVVPFIGENIGSPKWELRDAAIMAFNAVLEGPEEEQVTKLYRDAFPSLLKLLKDESVLVRDDTAFACGLVYELVPGLLSEKQMLEPLLATFMELLGDAPRVARCVCYSIFQIAESTVPTTDTYSMATNVLSPYFEGILKKLMEVTQRSDVNENELETAVFEALEMMLNASADDREEMVFELVQFGSQKLQDTFDGMLSNGTQAGLAVYNSIQSHWGPLLVAGVKKLSEAHLQEVKLPMLHLLHNIMNTDIFRRKQIDQTDSMYILHAIIDRLGSGMDPAYMHEFIMPHLYELLACPEDKEACDCAVLVLFDVCTNMNEKIEPYVKDIISICVKNLADERLDESLRSQFLSLFGDIGFALGPQYMRGQISDVLFEHIIGAMSCLTVPVSLRYDAMDFHSSLWQCCLEALSHLISVIIPAPEYANNQNHQQYCREAKHEIENKRLLTIQQLVHMIIHYIIMQDNEGWKDLSMRIARPAIALLSDVLQNFKGPFKAFWGTAENQERLQAILKYGKERFADDDPDSPTMGMIQSIIKVCAIQV